jgi:hypothetical protein
MQDPIELASHGHRKSWAVVALGPDLAPVRHVQRDGSRAVRTERLRERDVVHAGRGEQATLRPAGELDSRQESSDRRVRGSRA